MSSLALAPCPDVYTMMSLLLSTLALVALASSHSVITYPGWRGNNLIQNETVPYGMQWMYPCESASLLSACRDQTPS